MQFNEQLNQYIQEIKTNSKELANKSGLSPSVISRYRSGKRIPPKNSEQISMLAEGIALISKDKGTIVLRTEDIYNRLLQCIDESSAYTRYQANKLNTLIEVLNINTTELARIVNYDPSYISRVRSRQRIPSDAEAFIHKISSYVADTYSAEEDICILSKCLNCPTEHLETADIRQSMLEQWLSEKKREDLHSCVSFSNS